RCSRSVGRAVLHHPADGAEHRRRKAQARRARHHDPPQCRQLPAARLLRRQRHHARRRRGQGRGEGEADGAARTLTANEDDSGCANVLFSAATTGKEVRVQNTQELAGKVAIVTGAGRNIGRAIALDLAEAGAAVVVNARANRSEAENVAAVIEQAGGRAAVCLGDVGSAATASALVATAIERFGRLDIIVNNAAARREQAFATMTYEQWREITGTILDGPFHLAKAALPHLQRAGGGTIIH